MSAGRWAGVATSPQLGYSGNAPAPQDVDWGRVAGYAVIFTLALARGGVDDSRLNYANQQAFQHDAQATRVAWRAQPLGTTGTVPKHIFSPQQEYRDLAPAVRPISRAGTSGAVPPRTLVPQQEYRDLPPTVWGNAPALALGAVDDSRLSFGSQQANLHDQGVTRQIWASVVAALAPPPAALLPIYAAPQLADLTQQGLIWGPSLAQGRVPPTLFQPGQVDLTQQGWIRGTPPPRQGPVPPMAVQGQQAYADPPSSVRGPIPGAQGRVPAPTIQLQQAYTDVWARLTAPIAARQGPVPATTLIAQQSYSDSPSSVRSPIPGLQGKLGAQLAIPQQAYVDVPSSIKAPNAAAQGKVPALSVIPQQVYFDLPPVVLSPIALPQGAVPALTLASQSDPSQLPAIIWRTATATVIIPNPAAPFWCVPGQDENRQYSFIWPSLVAGQTPPIFSHVRAVQQLDTTQLAAQLWRSAFSVAITQPVSPFWSVPGQVDLVQQPLVFRPSLAQGAVPRQNFGVPQIFEHDQSYTRVVWSPIATSQKPMVRTLWATPQFVDLQPVRVTPAVFTPLARPAAFLAAAPQADPSINYSQVWVLRSFTTAGGQPFRAWVGIGRASSSTGEAGNVG